MDSSGAMGAPLSASQAFVTTRDCPPEGPAPAPMQFPATQGDRPWLPWAAQQACSHDR